MNLMAQLHDKLTLAQRNDAQGVVRRFKTVTQFLSEAVDAAKDNDAIQGVIRAIPWESVSIIGKGVVHALPPLKFVYSLTEKLTEITDLNELGYLACTVAYQHSVEQAFRALEQTKHSPSNGPALKRRLEKMGDKQIDFATFSYKSALAHPFVMYADAGLQAFAEGFHFDGDRTRNLVQDVHTRFVLNLKDVLATTDRFKNFRERIAQGTDITRAQRALQLHSAYQAWQFEDRAVFGTEQFSLRDIYVDTECGTLRWGEVRNPHLRRPTAREYDKPLDPFLEKNGGRYSLMHRVLSIIADPGFRDAIVIQGVAGSGKSTFTLRLCTELRKLGLSPIRIRLRNGP
jgi:hypothetical protein